MFFNNPLLSAHPAVVSLEMKMENVVNTIAAAASRPPLHLTEATQLVRYTQGEFYALHRDNDLDSATQGGIHPHKQLLKRAATLIIYLTDVEKGGGTRFPYGSSTPRSVTAIMQREGIEYLKKEKGGGGFCVHPRQGQALLFWNALLNGVDEDITALHAADPVQEGVKYIATRWFHE